MNLRSKCPYCDCSELKEKWRSKNNNCSITIMWCRNCDFGWQFPLPSFEETRNLYTNQGVYHEKIVNETQGGFPQRIAKLNKLKPEKGFILDIGSGLGHFLKLAQNTGWTVEGIEPKISASKYCYENFGIKVYNGFFEEWSKEKKYDVITMWDVLEHVHNPFTLLKKSTDMLSSNGLVIISIPNSSGLFARLFKGKWRYVMHHHINYFTMSFIKDILKKNRLDIIRTDHSIKAQSIFDGMISLLPKQINSDDIYKKTYQQSMDLGIHFSAKNKMKKVLRNFIYKFNMLSCPFQIGDLVDIYCKKIE